MRWAGGLGGLHWEVGMCPRCVPLDTCEVGRVTRENGTALDGRTHCVHCAQGVLQLRAAPASQVTLPTSQVSRGTHPGHTASPPNLPAQTCQTPRPTSPANVPFRKWKMSRLCPPPATNCAAAVLPLAPCSVVPEGNARFEATFKY